MLQHRLATPIVQPRMHFFDKDEKPLVGGKVFSFKVGEDEFKPTYRNSEFTAANQNPILLDQAGSALIYIRGAVQLKIYDKQGNFIDEKNVYQHQERAQFFDNYGKALSNGKVWTYDYQSTIQKTSYEFENTPNPNPVILDQNGYGTFKIVGAYRLRQFDKNDVFIGDQDFKRPPARVLTSRIYPLFVQEDAATLFNTIDSVQKIAMNQSSLDEWGITTFSMQSASFRDVLNNITAPIEQVVTSFAVASSSYRNVLISYTPEIEKLNTSLNMVSAIRKDVLIQHTTTPENATTSFVFVGAQITN